MRSLERWLFGAAGLAAVVVGVSSAVLAARTASWGPVVSAAWIPAVVVAVWPRGRRRCLSRGGGRARRADLRQ